METPAADDVRCFKSVVKKPNLKQYTRFSRKAHAFLEKRASKKRRVSLAINLGLSQFD
jgi:hypothetical protein